MMKKYIVGALLLTTLVLTPSLAGAQSIEDLTRQIQILRAQLAQLQKQQGSVAWCANFETNLGIGAQGEDVKNLRIALGKEGFGFGLKVDTNFSYYDEVVASAVSGFQLKYKDEILTPQGLTNPTGYFGSATRKKMNSLYGCNVSQPITPYITVLHPNGGEVFEKGSIVGIKWNSANYDQVFARISISGTKYYDLFPQTKNDGSEYWTISDDIIPGSYHLSVSLCRSNNDCFYNDYSDSYFKIYDTTSSPPIVVGPLTVSSPNGGEAWQKDTTQRIGWSWQTDAFVGQPFTIYLTPTNWSPTNPQLIIASGLIGTSYYDWNVGQTTSFVNPSQTMAPSQAYYVSVCAVSNFGGSQVCDQSDSYFKIYESNTTLPTPPTLTPLSVVSTNPPKGAIDARKNVSDINGRWQTVHFNFSGNTADVTDDDFEVSSEVATGNNHFWIERLLNTNSETKVILNRQLTVGDRVTITYKPTQTKVCLGVLPGDVDQSGMFAPADLLAMIDVLNGVKTVPLYAGDLNGSGVINATDHLTMIDLINAGTGARVPNCN